MLFLYKSSFSLICSNVPNFVGSMVEVFRYFFVYILVFLASDEMFFAKMGNAIFCSDGTLDVRHWWAKWEKLSSFFILVFCLFIFCWSIGGRINRETNDTSSRAECLMCLQLHIIDAHHPKNNTKKYEPTNTVLKKCLNIKYDIYVYKCICISIC